MRTGILVIALEKPTWYQKQRKKSIFSCYHRPFLQYSMPYSNDKSLVGSGGKGLFGLLFVVFGIAGLKYASVNVLLGWR